MSVSADDNIALAKKAWSHLINRTYGEDPRDRSNDEEVGGLFEFLDDDVVWKFSVPVDTPIYGGEFHGKEALKELRKGDHGSLDVGGLDGPPEFFGNGNRVVMLMTENYTIRKNGVKVSHKECAIVMDFDDGRITRVVVIQDQSEWNAAHFCDR